MSKVQESVELSDTVKPVFRIKNWSEYNKALEQRRLTLKVSIYPSVATSSYTISMYPSGTGSGWWRSKTHKSMLGNWKR